jgi:ubiquinone/menaquinone biosynthesis C-methylase UbiE
MIRAFVADIVFGLHPEWTQACAAPHAENIASWRALEKAGFRFAGIVGGKDGPGRLMVADRRQGEIIEPPPLASRGFVDYNRVASRYREGRSLPREVLDRWGSAVSPFLPSGPVRVLDVGAGTGVFAQAWPQWARAQVVAVEPSAAMVQAGDVVHPAVSFVRGVAEALPVRDATADVIWVSTALHHFVDVHRSVGEFGRVLGSAGRVLVRTYVPGRTEVTWVDEFPGRPKWEMRFHTEDQLDAIFGAHGFALSGVCHVLEWSESYADSARWAERMRHADSMLTALTDEEIAQGLERLRSKPTTVGRLELTLFVFTRP